MKPPEPGADAHLLEHLVSSQTLLQGGYLTVKRDTVRLPDGGHATRDYIPHSGAVAVIPVLDDGRLVLVRQHRYAVDRVLLEWPAGKLDAGEDRLACAQRELAEETGYAARQWAYAGELHNAAAYSSERLFLFFARGLQAGAARPDAGEFVETVLMTQAELEACDAAGTLTDVKTLIGLHWLQQLQSGRRAVTWTTAVSDRD